MEKIKISRLTVTEGRYDAARLSNVIDGLIITTDGFSIFTDREKRRLIRSLGRKRGVAVLTDSDRAGFKIRKYLNDICIGLDVVNVYVPPVKGKEKRKRTFSKEGLLGVEGIDDETIRRCLLKYGAADENSGGGKSTDAVNKLTYADLYDLGLSGTENAAENREKISLRLDIPRRLSKKAFLEVLNLLTDREKIEKILAEGEKPALFWDFHGTLTLPDNQWIDRASLLCKKYFPDSGVTRADIEKNLYSKCLPWWTYPDGDTRFLVENDGWWKSCEEEFVKMYTASGLLPEQAAHLAPMIRRYVVNPANHRLFPDALTVLKTLKDRGYKNYLLSNNFPELSRLSRRLGIGEYMEGCFVSAQVGYDKPRKEIFEIAAKSSGASSFVMIGDNPRRDISGAKACGFTTVLVNKTAREARNAGRDYAFENLSGLLDLFL